MTLPWINTTQNKTYRAWRNGIYGGALHKSYPPGVFYVSNTRGAPGQPALNRVLPAGMNQATDPRANSASLFDLRSNSNIASLIAPGTTNIGGNVTNMPATVVASSSHQWLLLGGLALMAWVIMR